MSAEANEGIVDIGSEQADLDASTDRYAKRFAGPSGAWLLSRQTEALRQLIGSDSGARVLDVGGAMARSRHRFWTMAML